MHHTRIHRASVPISKSNINSRKCRINDFSFCFTDMSSSLLTLYFIHVMLNLSKFYVFHRIIPLVFIVFFCSRFTLFPVVIRSNFVAIHFIRFAVAWNCGVECETMFANINKSCSLPSRKYTGTVDEKTHLIKDK